MAESFPSSPDGRFGADGVGQSIDGGRWGGAGGVRAAQAGVRATADPSSAEAEGGSEVEAQVPGR